MEEVEGKEIGMAKESETTKGISWVAGSAPKNVVLPPPPPEGHLKKFHGDEDNPYWIDYGGYPQDFYTKVIGYQSEDLISKNGKEILELIRDAEELSLLTGNLKSSEYLKRTIAGNQREFIPSINNFATELGTALLSSERNFSIEELRSTAKVLKSLIKISSDIPNQDLRHKVYATIGGFEKILEREKNSLQEIAQVKASK